MATGLEDQLTSDLVDEQTGGTKRKKQIMPLAAEISDPEGDGAGGDATPAPAPADPTLSPQKEPTTAPTPAPAYGQMPTSGYGADKWSDPNSTSAKYITGRSVDYAKMRTIPDEAGRKQFLQQEVTRITPDLTKAGWTVGGVQGDKMLISGNGYTPHWVDIVGDIEGAATPSWDDGGAAAAEGQTGQDIASAGVAPTVSAPGDHNIGPGGANTGATGAGGNIFGAPESPLSPQMSLNAPPPAPESTPTAPVPLTAAPGGQAQSTVQDTSNFTPQEAASAGLGWVPKDHPSYGTPGFVGYKAPSNPLDRSGIGPQGDGDATGDPRHAGGEGGGWGGTGGSGDVTGDPIRNAGGEGGGWGGAGGIVTDDPRRNAGGEGGGYGGQGLEGQLTQDLLHYPADKLTPGAGGGFNPMGGGQVPLPTGATPLAAGLSVNPGQPGGSGAQPGGAAPAQPQAQAAAGNQPVVPAVDTSDYTPAQAAAAGLGWVPKNHPSYGTKGFVGYKGGDGSDNPIKDPPKLPVDPNNPNPVTPPDPNDTSLEGQIKRMLFEQGETKKQQDSMKKKVHDSILGSIDDAGKPVDPNDPALAASSRSYRIGQEKALSRGREAMAGRAGAEGLTSGAFDSALQSSYENLGHDTAEHDAGEMGKRYDQKLQQLQQAQALGAGVMSAEESSKLNSSIAMLKARMDQLNLNQTGDLGNRELDLRKYIADKGFDIDFKKLGMSEQQFYDSLGLQIGQTSGSLNEQLMKLLTGH